MSGAFLMSRDWFNHPVFADEPFTEREAWAWLISEAAWKPRRYRAGSTLIELDRGQVAHSIRYMATAWKWHRNKVDRFLKRLKIETMIETETGTGVTVITICNYSRYQLGPSDGGTSSETPIGTAAGQQRDRKEEGNKYNNTVDDSARDPDLDLGTLSDCLFTAGGDCLNPTSTGLMVMSTPLGWINQGCDLDLDIIPTVCAVGQKAAPQSITSWNYFTRAIADAKARRFSPMPEGNSNVRTLGSKAFDESAAADRILHALG